MDKHVCDGCVFGSDEPGGVVGKPAVSHSAPTTTVRRGDVPVPPPAAAPHLCDDCARCPDGFCTDSDSGCYGKVPPLPMTDCDGFDDMPQP